MAVSPLEATGRITSISDDGYSTFEGSCAAFRYENVVITASHCVVSESATYALQMDHWLEPQAVVGISRHPDVDLAIACVEFRDDEHLLEPRPSGAFWDVETNIDLGEEFYAYGFPVAATSFDAAEQTPTPRLFKGHFQRFMEHIDLSGGRYAAAEMSVAAPRGLSGGPVFGSQNHEKLFGLVTGEVRSFTILDSLAEIDEHGAKSVIESRQVVTFGVMLKLAPHLDWVLETVKSMRP